MNICWTERSIAPDAAVLFDWENWWAVEDITGPRLDLDYPGYVMDHYRAFWEQGIEADIVDMDADLSGYRLVSAPLNYMYKSWMGGENKSICQRRRNICDYVFQRNGG